MPRNRLEAPIPSRRALAAVVLSALALGPAIAVTTGVAPASASSSPFPDAPPRSSEYVALGDSYAAGYGLPDPTGKPTEACGQSADDYPHRIANAFHLDLTDVSCAGATSANVASTRQNGQPPQIAALSSRTRTVTLSIGGNDADLFGTASSCLALSATGPVVSGTDVSNCRSKLVQDGTDTLAAKITGPVTKGITTALRAIRTAAPNAQIVVIGYPAIFPNTANTPSGGCFRSAVDASTLTGTFPTNSFPFTDVDVRYLHGVQRALDRATEQAASAAGVSYVSMLSSTEAHSACATRKPYVKGVQLSASAGLKSIDLVPGALHPNAAGAKAMASHGVAGIRAAYERAAAEARASASASATSTPTPVPVVGSAGFGAIVIVIVIVGLVVALAVVILVVRRRRRHRRERDRRS